MTSIIMKNPSFAFLKEELQLRSFIAGSEPSLTWQGTLYPIHSINSTFSTKVFVGGVPWDITEKDLDEAFSDFGSYRIEWPPLPSQGQAHKGRGYLYLIFEREISVKQLLGSCKFEYNGGCQAYYYKVSSAKMRQKVIQIIPWQTENMSVFRDIPNMGSDLKMVFVGSLHGMMTAQGLANIMSDLFGNVVAVKLDCDRHQYPIGSGRVVFSENESYQKAIAAEFVEVRTQKFRKVIQIEPFLQDSPCSDCGSSVGPIFCRHPSCFRYFCEPCYAWHYTGNGSLEGIHTPLKRSGRTSSRNSW